MTFVPVSGMREQGRMPTSGHTVWLADLTHTQQIITSDVMPAAIGSIATFTETQVDLKHKIRLFKYPEKLAEALGHEMPDVIGFSNYVWNSRLSYKFAEAIKKYSPRTVVVFGGPNYPTLPNEQHEFLKKRPLVDFYILKEGEVAFSQLLAELIEHDMDPNRAKSGRELPSVHWLRQDGSAALPHEVGRLQDLTVIPSPYISGRLDEFFDGRLIPILQTNRGCPFTCTFCVEGLSYYNKVFRSSSEKIAAEIEYIGRRVSETAVKGGRRDMYISDSNFGMYLQDLDTCRALAASMEKYGWPEYINTTTGKNNKHRILEAARLVKGALRLSGSVQSLDKEVLKNVKRANISEEEILELAIKSSELQANSYSEIILGLPGDSKRAHFESIRKIVDAGFNNVYTWQLMLLPGSELCTEESRQQFGMVTKYRVLPRCYGNFTVRDAPVSASEIEEVCVASNSLPFEDYLVCRRLHLMISIFYNDSVLLAILKLLKMLHISPFRWLELMANTPGSGPLKTVFDSFERETKDELWDNFEDLASFADRPENISRYVNGDIGNNLLFMHRTMALTQYIKELTEFAGEAAKRVIAIEHGSTPEIDAFIDDVMVYVTCRARNIFFDREQLVQARLRYNISAFEAGPNPHSLRDYAHETPVEYRFVLDPSQEDVMSRYLKIYGNNLVGVSRILMKLYVSRLYRRAMLNEDGMSAEKTKSYTISGLQDSLS